MDFKLSPAELPTPDTYKSATDNDKPRTGRYWKSTGLELSMERWDFAVSQANHWIDVYSFIQCDSEWRFSILRNIHTDQRTSLTQSTLISFMSIKFNSEECCLDTYISKFIQPYVTLNARA